jgi:hypothetical protein
LYPNRRSRISLMHLKVSRPLLRFTSSSLSIGSARSLLYSSHKALTSMVNRPLLQHSTSI